MVSSLIILIVSTVLISVFLKSYKSELLNEKNRMTEYLSSSISLSLNLIQDEIVNLFYSLSFKIDNDQDNINWEDDHIEQVFNGSANLSSDFPNIIEYVYLIKLKTMIELLPLYRSLWYEYEILRNLYLWETSYKSEKRQIIYIQNLSGFIAYPLTQDLEREEEEILLLGISLNEVIQNYLPVLITRKLSENLIESKNEAIDFNILVQQGDELTSTLNTFHNDMIVDLNEVFNMQKIETYFLNRAQRDLQKITSDTFLREHKYLIIRHKRGGITEYYNNKYYKIVLIVLAMALLVELLVQMIGIIHFKSLENHQMEQEFMTLVSHELNTPLCVISLCAENLSKGLFNKEKGITFYGNMIQKEAARLKVMVRNILLISNKSYSCKKDDFRIEKIDEIINDIKEKTQDLFEVYHTTLEVEKSIDTINLYCCRHLLVIVLFNIIENAVRYGAAFADKKIVSLKFNSFQRKNENFMSITIEDYGPGISTHDYKKVFRNFYRGHDVRNKQLPGSGLGLSLSRFIINEHSGKIFVVKMEEAGTTIKIWLPMGELNEKGNVD